MVILHRLFPKKCRVRPTHLHRHLKSLINGAWDAPYAAMPLS